MFMTEYHDAISPLNRLKHKVMSRAFRFLKKVLIKYTMSELTFPGISPANLFQPRYEVHPLDGRTDARGSLWLGREVYENGEEAGGYQSKFLTKIKSR